MSKTFYITTPIYYPSGNPHIGTVYTDVLADILARWNRLSGNDVFFTTGTDEHAQKVEKGAKELGISPKAYADKAVQPFVEVFQKYNISYSTFVRTTDKNHETYCQQLLKKLYDKGDIYKGKYEGWYCISCETYYTEKDLLGENCPLHRTKASWVEEEAYFFRMSKYQKRVQEYIKKQNYIFPKTRQTFLLNRMNKGLKDLCISRTNTEWGIPITFDKTYRIWVWFDALPNYLSSVQSPTKRKFWPADVHMIAHDILWHHSVIWLSMLFAAGIKPPKKLLVHGFILGEGGLKMSKSLGNVIDPMEVCKKYPVDSVRYFLAREIPFGSDGSFSMKALHERHNGELVNDLSNLHARSLSMIEKYQAGKIKQVNKNVLSKKLNLKKINASMQVYAFHDALSEIWKFVNICNKYINDTQPWELAKKNETKKLDIVLYNLADSLRLISLLIEAFMPETAEKIQKSLGMKKKESFKELKFGLLGNNTLQKVGYLFTRVEEEKMPTKAIAKKETLPMKQAQKEYVSELGIVSFKDWEKMKLQVGKIVKVDAHPNADRLYVLQIDLGAEKRQVVAGLREHYSPKELLHKNVIVFSNLQPSVIRDVESRGMLLAASSNGKVVLLAPEKDIELGARIS